MVDLCEHRRHVPASAADYGIGFGLIWNLVTTVSFDYGISSEGQVFQMDLGYAF
jgi:hypothetical protein